MTIEYIEEADREFGEIEARKSEQATKVEKEEVKPVEMEFSEKTVESPIEVFQETENEEIVEEAKPVEISVIEPEEERLRYRSFQTIVKGVAKYIYRRVLKAGEKGISIPLLMEDLEYEGVDPGTARGAIKKLAQSGAIMEEDGKLYPAGRKIIEKKRIGMYDGEAKVYRVYVEKIYPGVAVVVVNDSFRASVPLDFYDAPSASRSVWKKGKELKVLGALVRLDGKLHLRVYDILEEID
jgi:hypothetical protein